MSTAQVAWSGPIAAPNWLMGAVAVTGFLRSRADSPNLEFSDLKVLKDKAKLLSASQASTSAYEIVPIKAKQDHSDVPDECSDILEVYATNVGSGINACLACHGEAGIGRINGEYLEPNDHAHNRQVLLGYESGDLDLLYKKYSNQTGDHPGADQSAAIPKSKFDIWATMEMKCST